MRKIFFVMLVLGILLPGSLVIFTDPGILPGTETIQTGMTVADPWGVPSTDALLTHLL